MLGLNIQAKHISKTNSYTQIHIYKGGRLEGGQHQSREQRWADSSTSIELAVTLNVVAQCINRTPRTGSSVVLCTWAVAYYR